MKSEHLRPIMWVVSPYSLEAQQRTVIIDQLSFLRDKDHLA
ncbi:hypothetical protein [Rhodococcus sp. 06-235-1A]|nr:hypothetical protein [Rhodococcus sp. 06-235-1A]